MNGVKVITFLVEVKKTNKKKKQWLQTAQTWEKFTYTQRKINNALKKQGYTLLFQVQ